MATPRKDNDGIFQDTWGALIYVTDVNTGIDGTPRTLQSGDGGETGFQISTDGILVPAGKWLVGEGQVDFSSAESFKTKGIDDVATSTALRVENGQIGVNRNVAIATVDAQGSAQIDPSVPLDAGANELLLEDAAGEGAGATIRSASTARGKLHFADSQRTDAGAIEFDHGSDKLEFYVGGQLLVSLSSGFFQSTRNTQMAAGNGIFSAEADSLIFMTGGNAGNSGGNIFAYGQSHASLPDRIVLRSSSTVTAEISAAGGHVTHVNITPDADNALDLGASGARFRDAYVANGVTTTSDGRLKDRVDPLSPGLRALIWKLTPVSFTWNREIQRHAGLIAQEVEAAMAGCGLEPGDFGGLVRRDGEDEQGRPATQWGLRYDQFVVLLIRAVQDLAREIEQRDEQLKALGRRVAALEEAAAATPPTRGG